ncbi:MAG: hypothetical protein ACPGVN_03995 [Alphaproteobacteria bacterium]
MREQCEFNIRNSINKYMCPVCGYSEFSGTPAYDSFGKGIIGTTICSCCLWQPGFDDEPSASGEAKSTVRETIIHYRSKWEKLAEWQGIKSLKPEGFSGKFQLKNLKLIAPDLFDIGSDLKVDSESSSG